MMLMPDLFSFAYVPSWYLQLDALAELALPEPWSFRNPLYLAKNPDTPILERYIHTVFRKQAIEFNNEPDSCRRDQFFYVRNEYSCFHTCLFTTRFKAIYACFVRIK